MKCMADEGDRRAGRRSSGRKPWKEPRLCGLIGLVVVERWREEASLFVLFFCGGICSDGHSTLEAGGVPAHDPWPLAPLQWGTIHQESCSTIPNLHVT